MRQEDFQFNASLGYIARSCLEKPQDLLTNAFKYNLFLIVLFFAFARLTSIIPKEYNFHFIYEVASS